ncbi:MAG: hypothetical protein ABIQ40_10150 [Bacteroidia bacterium]
MQSVFRKFCTRDGLLFLLLLLLIILLRIFVLRDFAFPYTDSDQVMMWQGLKDFSNGEFHEPRYYGQAYNSMLESFLAVPFYKAGMAAHKCLPLITSILALFPIVLISFFVFLKKSPKLSLLILSIPLALPVEYSLITTMPRGFITGIFINSFACIGIFYPKSKWSFLLCFFLAVLGFSVNANSVLLAFPCLAFLFVENIKNKSFYLYAAAGTAAGLLIHFAANYFYITHPFYNVHPYEFAFSTSSLFTSLRYPGLYFNDVTPFCRNAGVLSPVLFLLFAFLLYRKKEYRKAIIVVLIPFLVILTLGINKVHDGQDSVYFSYSRMYLAIPVMLAFIVAWFNDIKNNNYFYLYLLIPLACLSYQAISMEKTIQHATDPLVYKGVTAVNVDSVYIRCNELNAVCVENKINLVLVIDHPDNEFYNYACSSCMENFPNALRPESDRRTWRYQEDENKVYPGLLLIDTQRNYAAEFPFIKQSTINPNFYLLENNKKPTMELLNSLGIWFRPFK